MARVDEQPGGCSPGDCPYAEALPTPSADLYSIPTPDDAEVTSTLADLEGDVTNAENNGGGWLVFSFHQICDTSTSGCDPVYSWSPELFQEFATWLASQPSGLSVQTVQQVIGGTDAAPVTTPTLPANSFAICFHRAGVTTPHSIAILS